MGNAANPSVAGTSPAAHPAPDQSQIVECSCGTKMRAPASAIGKAVRCPCGKLVPVRSKTTQHIQPATNWLKDLPPTAAPTVVSSPHLAEQDYWDAPEVVAYDEPYQQEKSREQTAHVYLDKAEKELSQISRWGKSVAADQLNGTRWLLVFLGLLTIGFNGYGLVNIQPEVAALIAEDESAKDSEDILLLFGRLTYLIFIGCGILFIIFGALVYSFPLTSTIAALSLYLFGVFIAMVIVPESLFSLRSILSKFFIIGALLKSVVDSAHYRRA